MSNAQPDFDVLAAGELLMDLLGEKPTGSLAATERFRSQPGGSAANLAANLARLGRRTALVACVGADSLGQRLAEMLRRVGVETAHVVTDATAPTTLVLVTRTAGTADFIAYRGADYRIRSAHLPDELLRRCRVFHTTCFALSRAPARRALLDAVQRSRRLSPAPQISLDANYAPSIWSDRAVAQRIVAEVCAHGALVKLSADDAGRLFDGALTPEAVTRTLHDWGAALVCLTLGAEGSHVSWEGGRKSVCRPAAPLAEVVDATGAGDAFWAGFLAAYLDGHSPPDCADAGGRLAAHKLRRAGPLPDRLDPAVLYQEINAPPS